LTRSVQHSPWPLWERLKQPSLSFANESAPEGVQAGSSRHTEMGFQTSSCYNYCRTGPCWSLAVAAEAPSCTRQLCAAGFKQGNAPTDNMWQSRAAATVLLMHGGKRTRNKWGGGPSNIQTRPSSLRHFLLTTLHDDSPRSEHLHDLRHDWLEQRMERLVVSAILQAQHSTQ
jgi:hypothetical protein